MKKGKKLYEGKAKILYAGSEKGIAIQHFKDHATAFNNLKKSTIDGKGILNNRISEHIFSSLNQIGIETHLIKRINMREQLIKLVEIIPIEFIVRNIAAGSLTKRLGIEEGTVLKEPLLEFCYKNDSLGDPFIAREHIYALGYSSVIELDFITNQCFRVNDFLQGMFKGIGIKLVDFKLEFGRLRKENGTIEKILVADEISPDTCRLWDETTDQKLDKDIFRNDLGDLIKGYQEVAKRLGILHEHSYISPIKFTKPTAVKIKKK
jgi:phosphoribosylaminoimidazole-succinocarboxamide synthase